MSLLLLLCADVLALVVIVKSWCSLCVIIFSQAAKRTDARIQVACVLIFTLFLFLSILPFNNVIIIFQWQISILAPCSPVRRWPMRQCFFFLLSTFYCFKYAKHHIVISYMGLSIDISLIFYFTRGKSRLIVMTLSFYKGKYNKFHNNYRVVIEPMKAQILYWICVTVYFFFLLLLLLQMACEM